MNEIKNALLLLSKEIRNLCHVDIRSEHLRLAKFNQIGENNVELLWQVLLSFCLPRCGGLQRQYGDVLSVKCYLASVGYKRMEFYHLPSNKENGSRELLIAIAWIIAKEDKLDSLMREKMLDFYRQICVCNTGHQLTEQNPQDWKKSFSCDDSLNYILHLCTKLKNCVKNMYNYEEELIKLTDRVHQATQNVSGVPHLSLDEASILLCREVKPSIHKAALEIRSILNTHLKWNACSSIFWKWMDTVLENADMESCSQTIHGIEPVTEFIHILLACFNAKVRSAEEPKIAASCDLGYFPRFIFQSSRDQQKHSDLSVLQKCVESKLAVHKEAAKKLEMELYQVLKNIAETKMGPVVFVIPQMYTK